MEEKKYVPELHIIQKRLNHMYDYLRHYEKLKNPRIGVLECKVIGANRY